MVPDLIFGAMAFVAILCGIKLRKNKIAKTEAANQEKADS